MLGYERQDARKRGHKVMRELGEGRGPDNHEQSRFVRDHGRQFVGFVPDAAVVRDRHPLPLGCQLEPFLISGGRCKVVRMPLDEDAGLAKDPRELQTKIAIGEEDNLQAARS